MRKPSVLNNPNADNYTKYRIVYDSVFGWGIEHIDGNCMIILTEAKAMRYIKLFRQWNTFKPQLP
jgi:hypothetical protein